MAASVFIIQRGQIEIFKEGAYDLESVKIPSKGSMFGKMALMNDQPRMASEKAINSQVRLLIINRKIFKKY